MAKKKLSAIELVLKKIAKLFEVSIAGKQDVIDAQHKLSADLITDGATNKVINVKPDWNATSGDAFIKNKPTIPSPTAVKGNAESSYRTGNVNITPANIGLGNVVDTGDSATPVKGGTTKFTTGGAYTELNKKVDKVQGKGLSTNDYDDTAKSKVDNIPSSPKYTDTTYQFEQSGNTLKMGTNNETKSNIYTPSVPSVASTSSLLKGDGNGNAVAATEGTDYQAPLSFKTTPSNDNKVVTESDIEDFAEDDGTYPDMTVGKSQNIFGSTETNDMFVYRPTAGIQDIQSGQPGLGGAEVQKIEGNGVAWNQLVDYTKINSYESYGLTITNNNDGSFSVNGTSTGGIYYLRPVSEPFALPQGHKIFVKGTPEAADYAQNLAQLTSYGMMFQLTNGVGTEGLVPPTGRIFDLSYDGGIYQMVIAITYNTVIDAVFKPQVIDLTLIFGVGNEPSTVAEFETWLANNVGLKDYYPYCEGELIGVNTIKVKTTGFNQLNNGTARVLGGKEYEIVGNYTAITLDGDTITPSSGKFTPSKNGTLTITDYDSNTCIHLVHSGSRDGEYEPYWSEEKELEVGRIYGKLNGEGNPVKIWSDGVMKGCLKDNRFDNIDIVNGCARIVTGVKDLGTLSWQKDPDRNQVYCGNFSGKMAYGSILTGKFAPADANYWGIVKECGNISVGIANNEEVYIGTNDASDAFIASLNGVVCWYQLSEEVIYSGLYYDTSTLGDGSQLVPLQEFVYAVDDYGTEELLLDNGTATTECAPKMSIKYGINAADAIKNLPHNYVSVKAQSLSSSEKAQARQNIGACAISDVPSSLADIGALSSIEAISVNTSSACSITGSGNAGKTQTIIYTNSGSSDLTVTVPTDYTTPDGQAIELTCKAGGYCEVSYLNVGGTIYARGL